MGNCGQALTQPTRAFHAFTASLDAPARSQRYAYSIAALYGSRVSERRDRRRESYSPMARTTKSRATTVRRGILLNETLPSRTGSDVAQAERVRNIGLQSGFTVDNGWHELAFHHQNVALV